MSTRATKVLASADDGDDTRLLGGKRGKTGLPDADFV
jgi:hypothetical protein